MASVNSFSGPEEFKDSSHAVNLKWPSLNPKCKSFIQLPVCCRWSTSDMPVLISCPEGWTCLTGILKFADTFDNMALCSAQCQWKWAVWTGHESSERDSLDIDCERRVCVVAIHEIKRNLPLETEDALHMCPMALFTKKDWFYFDRIKSKSFITKHISSLPDLASTGESGVILMNHTKQKIGLKKRKKKKWSCFLTVQINCSCVMIHTEDIYPMSSPIVNLSNQNLQHSHMETFLVCATPENNLYIASHLLKHLSVYNPLLNCWQELAERLLDRMIHKLATSMGASAFLVVGTLYLMPGSRRLNAIAFRGISCYLKCNKHHETCVFQDQIICLCDIPTGKVYKLVWRDYRCIVDIPIDSSALNYQVVQHKNKLLLLTLAIASKTGWS